MDNNNNLLDTLAGFVNEVAASRQAALGNAAPLQILQQQQQQQQQQQNLLNQLQSLSQEELQGPFGKTLQRQLQFGDIQGAQKTLVNLPKYQQAQDLFKNPKLGLPPEELESLQLYAAADPEGALSLGRRFLGIGREKKGQMEVEERKEALRREREERVAMRKAEQTPGAVIEEAVRAGQLKAENAEKALPGLLRRKGIKVPTDAAQRQVFIQDLLQDPKLQLVPAKTKSSIFNFFSKEEPAAPVEPVAPAAPAAAPAQEGQILRSPSTGQRFLRKPDGSLVELK